MVAVALFGAAFYFYKARSKDEAERPPIPFIEEKVEEEKAPPPQEEEKQPEPQQQDQQEIIEAIQEPAQAEPVEERAVNPDEPVGDACPEGHPLALSTAEAGYPGGYYMCAKCNRVLQCSLGRWNCAICNIDVCTDCKPAEGIQEEPVIEEAAREPDEEEKGVEEPQPEEEEPQPEEQQHEVEQVEEPQQIEVPQPVEEPQQEEVQADPKSGRSAERSSEGNSPSKSMSYTSLEKAALTSIKQIIASKQTEDVSEYRKLKANGRVSWIKTHFIFVIDCSGSMKGTRWESVKTGFSNFLQRIKKTKEVIVSAFTFDDKPNPFCREKTPTQAISLSKNLPFTGKGTNYKRALDYATSLIKKSMHQDYLSCIILLSDGLGGFPEDSMIELQKMKTRGKKVLLYTIACETDEEVDLMQMATMLKGDHYKVTSTEAAKLVFATILGV